jgi:hypothetical protein
MGEHILTSCPACGFGVRADPDVSSFKCPACGHIFYLSHNHAAAPAAPAQRIPRWGLVVLTIVAPLVITGLAIYAALHRGGQHGVPEVDDYLAQPEAVPERVRLLSEQVRQINLTPSRLEVYDAEGRRYTLSNSGEFLRHPDGDETPAESFAIDKVDFGKLPGILTAASERGDGRPTKASVEVEGDTPIWRISVLDEHGTRELVYSLDGQLRR